MGNAINALLQLAKTIALISLLVCGSAHAMLSSFEGYAVASDDELDKMRGGFEINLNGMQFLLAFSIERLSYTNGVLVAHTSFNLLDLLKGGSLASAVTNKLATPGTGAISSSPELLKNLAQVDAAFATQDAQPNRNDPASPAQRDNASDQVPAPLLRAEAAPIPPGKMTMSSPPSPLGNLTPMDRLQVAKPNASPGESTPHDSKATDQVVTTLSTFATPLSNAPAIQHVNGVTLNANALQSVNSQTLNTYLSNLIQNTVNGEVLRNITILNATINARALAASDELNAALNRGHR